ncbi:MAG: DNA-binding protein [Clostridia bacterium]|nr:DNA-binding protein [Clostridia bacterium]
MEKNLNYSALLSSYGALLTDKQAQTLEYYYDEDLSLGEIAENMGISRQGVRDFIKRGEEMLDDYEAKLKLCEKAARIEKAQDALRKIKAVSSGSAIDALADEALEELRGVDI